MSSYSLKPGLTQVFLPGVGRVTPWMTITGDNLQRFVPQFLVEVVEVAPVVITLPEPEPEPEPVVAPKVVPAPKASAPAPVPESPKTEAPANMRPTVSEPIRPKEKKEKKR